MTCPCWICGGFFCPKPWKLHKTPI